MTKRIRIAVAVAMSIFAVGMLPASALPAQITLEAQQGTAWSNSLTVTQLETLHFRWKWAGTAAAAPSWQITFTAPASVTFPQVIKSVPVSAPAAAGVYAGFDIAPDALPAGTPSTFYVRIRSTGGASQWLTVVVTQTSGARSAGTGDRLDAALQSDPTRATTGTSIPRLPTAPPSAPAEPFVIPGGGGGSDLPIWGRLSTIVCEFKSRASADDDDESDEVYAIVASIALDRKNLAASPIFVTSTSVYDGITSQSFRTPRISVWGPPAGSAVAMGYPDEVVLIAAAMERDTDRPLWIVRKGIEALLLKELSTIPTSYTPDQMAKALWSAMNSAVYSFLVKDDGDDRIDLPKLVPVTGQDFKDMAAGTVVKKTVRFQSTDGGWYDLHLQFGKSGVSPEAW